MEEKNSTTVPVDALKRKIDELMKDATSNPGELEEIKSIIRKNVNFFDRMTLAAILLRNVSANSVRKDERPAKKQKPERQEKKIAEKEAKPQKPRPERIIPEGAKTLYINIGKMKHLYAKDLSKLLQTELGITRDDIYQIRVHDKYSFVTMSEENCTKAIEKLNNQEINGRNAKVTYSEK